MFNSLVFVAASEQENEGENENENENKSLSPEFTMGNNEHIRAFSGDEIDVDPQWISNSPSTRTVFERCRMVGIKTSKNSISEFKSINISQVSRFNDSYFRNNKQNTEKTIRCFPSCSSNGHQRYGNCCSDITATCDFIFKDISGKGYGRWDDLLVFGEFRPENEETRYNLNALLSDDVLQDIVVSDKTRVESGHTLMRAKLTLLSEKKVSNKTKMARVIITICPPMGGFCYAWKSNRWVAETRHCIEYTIFERTNWNNSHSPLKVIAVHKPRGDVDLTFRIVSTRTNYNHTKAVKIEEEKMEVSSILCLLNNNEPDDQEEKKKEDMCKFDDCECSASRSKKKNRKYEDVP